MMQDPTSTIAGIVKENYLAADVFKRYGLSYCCGGNVDLHTACVLRNLDPESLRRELAATRQVMQLPPRVRLEDWPLSFAVDYVIHIYHRYFEKFLPGLVVGLSSFVAGHQRKYPHLSQVNAVVGHLQLSILSLLAWQEAALFPELLSASHECGKLWGEAALRKEVIEEELIKLKQLTHHYQPPSTACTRHQVFYHQLRELQEQYEAYILAGQSLQVMGEALN